MNTNKINTKLLATITIMLLFASAMLAVVPAANATISVAVSPGTVQVGGKITATGNVSNPGATVSIYIDNLEIANRLNATRATSSANATYSIDANIPELKKGAHDILVVEEVGNVFGSGQSASAPITIGEKLTLTLSKDIRGATVEIKGTGFTPHSTGGQNNTLAFRFYNTTGNVTDMVLPTSPSAVRPNVNGTFTAYFTVPNLDYGSYTVSAITASGSASDSATAAFAIGPVITLSPNNGLAGTQITIKGRGFTPGTTLTTLNFTSGAVLRLLNESVITIDGAGEFEANALVHSGAYGTHTIAAQAVGGLSGEASFRISNNANGHITVSPIAGYPTTPAGPGDLITVTGSNFATIAGTKVTLTLTQTGAPSYHLGEVTTNSDGTFTAEFIVPTSGTGEYNVTAMDAYGITGSAPFGVSILSVGLYDDVTAAPITYDVTTGMNTTIKGTGFNVFGDSYYTANITIDGKIIPNGQNVGHQYVNGGISAIIGAVGSTMEPGTYTVGITAYVHRLGGGGQPAVIGYIRAETKMTVSKTAEVTVSPQIAPRNSTVLVEGAYFTNNSAVTIRIFNATTGVQVGSSYTATVGTNKTSGIFARNITIPIDFKLGDYIINVTDTNRVTAKTTLTVAKVSINITLGSNTYAQGDIATFQLTSNTAPIGSIKVYDSSGATFATIPLTTANWVKNGNSYSYQQSGSAGGVPFGAMIQLASDARTGAWKWEADVQDANEPQKYNGTFTVNAKTATPTPPPTATATTAPSTPPSTTAPTSAPPTAPATSAPADKGTDRTTLIIIVAVVALIVGVIAVFLFVTMRRKIAN